MATKKKVDDQPECNMDVLLRCPICKEYYKDPVMISQCSHNFCSECIRRSLLHNAQCPVCRTKTLRSHLHPNKIINQLLNSYSKMEDPPPIKSGSSSKSKNTKSRNMKSRGIQCDLFQSSPSPVPPSNSNPKSKKKRSNIQSFLNPIAKRSKTSKPSKSTKSNSRKRKASSLNDGDDIQMLQPPSSRRKLNESQSQSQSSGKMVHCPICSKLIHNSFINLHIDQCLSADLISKTGSDAIPSPKCTEVDRIQCIDNEVEVMMDEPVDDDQDIDILQDETSKSNGNHNVNHRMNRNNDEAMDTDNNYKDLIRAHSDDFEHEEEDIKVKEVKEEEEEVRTKDNCPLKLMAYPAYTHLNEKDLRKTLKKIHLNTKGEKKVMVKRHREFVLRHNAQIDAYLNGNEVINDREIARQINNEESKLIHSNFFDRKSNSSKKKEIREEKREQHFKELIAALKERMGKEWCRKRRKFRKKRRKIRREERDSMRKSDDKITG